jgi:hypothetical protein
VPHPPALGDGAARVIFRRDIFILNEIWAQDKNIFWLALRLKSEA